MVFPSVQLYKPIHANHFPRMRTIFLLLIALLVLSGCGNSEENIKKKFLAIATKQAEQLRNDVECPAFDDWHYFTIEHIPTDDFERKTDAELYPGKKRYSVLRTYVYKPEIEVTKSDSLMTPYVGKLTYMEVWEALMTTKSSYLKFFTDTKGKVVVEGEYFKDSESALAWGKSNAALPSIGAFPAFQYRFNMDRLETYANQPCWLQIYYAYTIEYGYQDGKWIETLRDIKVSNDVGGKHIRAADGSELLAFTKRDKFTNPALPY